MKICLIGSTRFIDRFHEANRLLTLAGHIVYSVATMTTSHKFAPSEQTQPEPISAHDKEWLDLVHLCKIQESDVVLVIGLMINPSNGDLLAGSYVGESTRREMRWAAMTEKELWAESALEKFTRSKDSPRYNLEIPGHEDPAWKHDCKRDHRWNKDSGGYSTPGNMSVEDFMKVFNQPPIAGAPTGNPEDKPS